MKSNWLLAKNYHSAIKAPRKANTKTYFFQDSRNELVFLSSYLQRPTTSPIREKKKPVYFSNNSSS